MCIFFGKTSEIRWPFSILVNVRVNGHIFRVKKSFIYIQDPILGHPVYQFFPDTGNISHYAGRIRILWPVLRGHMRFIVKPNA